jgi:cation diffusion facilitator CzcD-associated flavoprotein CzcO
MAPSTTSPDVIIVGAGFSGIGMAIRLKMSGIDSFVILEKSSELGGVWRDNTYPGAACDAPSHLYSYSFEPNYPWSRKFAPQGEILAYLRHCADKYSISSHIRADSEVVAASFHEQASRWEVHTKETIYRSRVLVAAVGQLHAPAFPDIPGVEAFGGVHFHSARWNHAQDLRGKSVAVIGTGSTAIQVVPSIAARVRKLLVFQRSPGYVRPKPDKIYAPAELARFERFPILRRLDRALTYCRNEARFINFDFAPLNRRAQRQFRAALENRIADPELRRKLTPDYALGCKRGLPSNDWFPALTRENVELITAPIARIVPEGLETLDGRVHTVDTLIFATGFKATQFLAPIHIRGVQGRDLHEVWKDGAEAYLGMSVSGFPNLFLLYGPNTNLAHSSVVYMLESQFRYVLQAVTALVNGGVERMDVRADIQTRFNAALDRRLQRSVLVLGGCTSWFKTASGKVTNNWPTFSFLSRWKTRWLKLDDYQVERRPPPTAGGARSETA